MCYHNIFALIVFILFALLFIIIFISDYILINLKKSPIEKEIEEKNES